MADLPDVTPVKPIWPTRPHVTPPKQQHEGGKKKKREQEDKRGNNDGHIDEYA